ncbi:hypothetical protein K435DRAFT_881070, partial [Dendrothele bispora CBS 962.96]
MTKNHPAELTIPDAAVKILIPTSDATPINHPNESILSILNLNMKNLPKISTTTTAHLLLPDESIFTKSPSPIASPEQSVILRSQCRMPNLSEIDRLLERAAHAHLKGCKSMSWPIQETARTINLPLWTPTFWGLVYDIYAQRDIWTKTQAWLADHAYTVQDIRFF